MICHHHRNVNIDDYLVIINLVLFSKCLEFQPVLDLGCDSGLGSGTNAGSPDKHLPK